MRTLCALLDLNRSLSLIFSHEYPTYLVSRARVLTTHFQIFSPFIDTLLATIRSEKFSFLLTLSYTCVGTRATDRIHLPLNFDLKIIPILLGIKNKLLTIHYISKMITTTQKSQEYLIPRSPPYESKRATCQNQSNHRHNDQHSFKP